MGAAIDEFRRAVALDANYVSAQTNLANILTEKGDFDEAIGLYERAIKLAPDRADIHFKFADVLQRAGRGENAIGHYHTALRLKPDFLLAYANLAQLLASEDRPSEAIATAQQGIEAARATGQEQAAEQLEEWLGHYQRELQRN